jgi:ssDNA-binding Zn-finger/Zn-ribbon topoisomerase 1
MRKGWPLSIRPQHTNLNIQLQTIQTGQKYMKIKVGYDSFELNVANRIMEQTPEKVFFNNCPKCNKLARTPRARQCRHCGHSWHDLSVV